MSEATTKMLGELLVGLLVRRQPLLLAEAYMSVWLLVLLAVLVLLVLAAGWGCCICRASGAANGADAAELLAGWLGLMHLSGCWCC